MKLVMVGTGPVHRLILILLASELQFATKLLMVQGTLFPLVDVTS